MRILGALMFGTGVGLFGGLVVWLFALRIAELIGSTAFVPLLPFVVVIGLLGMLFDLFILNGPEASDNDSPSN